MKLTKLNARGFSHDILIVLFVVVFAIAGVGYIVASHADSCNRAMSGPVTGPVSRPGSGPVSGAACYQPGRIAVKIVNAKTKEVLGNSVSVIPVGKTPANGCIGRQTDGTYSTLANITCTPGKYRVSYYKAIAPTKQSQKGIVLSGQTNVTVKAGKTTRATIKARQTTFSSYGGAPVSHH